MTIVATSLMVARALEAAAQLASRRNRGGGSRPAHAQAAGRRAASSRSVCKTGRVLIVHEACKTGGFGGEIAAVLAESEAFDYLDAPIRRLAGLDIPVPYNRDLERRMVPQVEDIAAAARRLVKEAK